MDKSLDGPRNCGCWGKDWASSDLQGIEPRFHACPCTTPTELSLLMDSDKEWKYLGFLSHCSLLSRLENRRSVRRNRLCLQRESYIWTESREALLHLRRPLLRDCDWEKQTRMYSTGKLVEEEKRRIVIRCSFGVLSKVFSAFACGHDLRNYVTEVSHGSVECTFGPFYSSWAVPVLKAKISFWIHNIHEIWNKNTHTFQE